MQENNIECREYETAGTAVYVAADGRYMGCIILADKLKADSLAAVSTMREESVQKIIMLTGDNERIASEVAEKAGIDGFFAGLLPSDKVERLSGIKQTAKGTVLFAGDGMNDAPCLAAADTGVAMGALGSDAAIEAADVVIMNDSLAKIPEAVRYSRKCMRIVWGNVVFAIGIKVLVLVLAALGHANMIMGIFADVGVSIICILNSMRTLKKIRDR
jgi:Cd2+/Zn2+-exporting ATPase